MNSDNDQVMDDSGTSPEILDSTVSRIWYSVSSVPVLFWNVFCSQLNPLMKLYYVIVTSLDGSRGKQRKLLCWLEAMSGREVRDLQAVWQDGSIVCDIINAVMVGNCEPKDHHGNCLRHAQELASHHFKLLPVFSNSELQKPFNSNFEKRLWRYLLALRNALKHRLANNMADQDEKDPEYLIAEEYVARGMGLILASRGERAIFFIYSRDDSSLADIHIHVKGPNGDCGEATAGEPIDSQHHSIAIDYRLTPDYLKVCYIPNSLGRHELSLTRYGFNIPGSPFIIKVGEHTGPPAEKFSYLDWLTEEQEEEQRLEIERKRKLKVVSRVIDFITEKVHMTEDGQLVKFDNNSSLRVPSPIPHNPKRTGRSLSPRSRCKLSSQRRSKSLTNQKLIQAAEFLKFSKEEKKCVQDAASQVSEDFSMIQPVGIDQFQEKCQRIVRACDFLLSHAPKQKSLEILTTAEKILDIPYKNTLTHHKSLFELYRPEFETPDINLQNLTTESSRSSETDDDKEVIKPCTPEINVTRVDFSDRLYSMRRFDDLGLNAVSDFNNDSTANENISTPQLNREKNRSKSTSPQKDARMARKSFQTVGYTKAKRSSQTSIPTNNLSDEIGLSDNTNENIEENSIDIIDDGICLSDNKNGNIGGQSTKKIDDSMSLNDIKNENHERNSTSYIGDEICLTSDETGRFDAEEKKEAQHQLIGKDENLPIVSVVETNVDHSEKHAEDEISFEHSSTRLSRNRQPKITRNSKQAKTVSNLVKQFENQSVCSNVSLVGNELSSDLKTNGDENAIGNSMESSIDNNDSNKTNCVMTGDNLKTEIKNDDREMRSRVIEKKSIEKTDETEKIVQETEICEPKNIISDESTLSTSDKSKENMELITGEQNITINEQTGTINEQNITVDEQIVNEIDEKTKKIVIIGDENIIGRERKDESNAQDKIDDFIRNSEKHLEIAENNDSNSSSRQLNKDENKTLAENIPQIDIEKEAGENDTLQETSYKEEVKVPTSIKSRISAFEDYSRKIENDSLLNKKFKKVECVADEKSTSNEDGVVVNENDSESVAENKSNQLGDIEYPSEVTVVKDSINKSVEDYIKSMNEVLDEVEELSNSNFVENFEDKNKKVENEKIEDKTHFEMIEEIQKSNANVDDSVECSGKQEEREFKSENELTLENSSQNIGEEHSATVDALNGECVLLSMKHLSFDDDQSLQASDFVKLKDFEIVDKTILSEEEYGTPIWVNEIIIPIEKGELVENHELNDSENLVTPELISEQEVVVIRDDIEVTNRDQENKDIDIITGLIQDSITDKKLLAFDNETSNGSDNNLSSITEQELKLKTNIKNPENVDHLLKTEQITATPSIGFIEPEESIPLESPENTTITEDRPTDLIILENKSGNDEHEVVQVLKPSAFNTNSTLEDNEEYVTYLNEQLPIVNEKINVSPSDIETDDQKNNLLPRESVISDTTSKDGLNDGSATPEIILKEDVIEQKSDDKIENVESLSENVTEEDFKTITNASHDTLEIITIENQNQESPFTNEEEFDMDVNENKNLRSTISVVEELRKSLGIACVAHPKVVNFEIKCDNTLSENPECKVNLVTDVTVSEDVREYNLNETGETTENENEDIPDKKDEITVKHDDHDFQKIGIDKNVDEKDIELNPDITQNTDISGNAVNSLINETVDCSEQQEIISSEFFVTNNYEDEKIIDIENIEQSLEDPVIVNEKINDSIIPPEVDHTLENIISSGDKVSSNVNVNEVENLNKNEKNGDCLMKDPEGSIETVVIDEGNTCVLPVDIELEAEEKKFKIQQQEEIKINRSSDEIENDISTDLAEQEVDDRVLVVATKDGNETKVGNLESEKEQIMVEIITEEDILKDDEKELILPVKIDEKDENEHITIEGEASNENVASVEETEADNLVLDSAEIALAEIDVETNIKQVEEIESSVEHCSSILKQAGVECQKLDSIKTNAEDLLKNTIEDEPIEQELLLASDDQKANNKEVDSNYEEVILEDHVKYNSIVFNSQGQEIEIESAKVEEEKLVAVSDEGQLISGSSDQETKNEEDYSFDKITKLEEPVIEVIAENDVVINSVTEIQNLETSNSNKEISKEANDQKYKVHFEAENKGEHLIGDTEVTEISLANIKLEDNSLINDKSNKLDQIIIDEKIEKNIEVYRNSLTDIQNFEASNSNEEISEETVQQKDKVYFEAENKGEDLICVTEISEIGQLNAKLEEDSSDGKQPNDLHQITSDNKLEELEKILEEVENLEEVTNGNEFKVESEINIISNTSKAVMITEDQVPQTFEFDNDHIETKVEIIIVNTATTPAQIGIESDDNSTESIKLMECLSQNETPNNVQDESHIIEEEITLEQYSGNNLGEEIENYELLVVSGVDENRLPQSENLPFESGLQSAAVLEKTTYEECVQENENIMEPVDNDVKISNEEGELPIEAGSVSQFSDEGISKDTESNGCFLGSNVGIKETAEEKFVEEDNRIKREKEIIGKNEKSENIIGVTDTFENHRGDNSLEEINCQKNLDELAENLCNISARISVEHELKDINSGDFVECKFGVEPIEKIITEVICEDIKTELALQHNEIDNKMDIEGDISFLIDSTKDSTIIEDNVGDLGDKLNFIDSAGDEYENLTEIPCKVQKTENQSQADSGEIYTGEEFDINLEPTSQLNEIDISLNETTLKQNEVESTLGKDIETNLETSLGEKAAQKIIKADLCENFDEVEMQTNINLDDVGSKINSNLQKDVEINNDTLYLNDDQETVNSENELEMKDDSKEMKESDISNENNANLKISSDSNLEESSPIANVEDRNDKNLIINSYLEQSGPTKDLIANVEDESNLFDESTQLIDVDEKIENEIISVLNEENVEDTCTNTEDENMENISNSEISSEPQSSLLLEKYAKIEDFLSCDKLDGKLEIDMPLSHKKDEDLNKKKIVVNEVHIDDSHKIDSKLISCDEKFENGFSTEEPIEKSQPVNELTKTESSSAELLVELGDDLGNEQSQALLEKSHMDKIDNDLLKTELSSSELPAESCSEPKNGQPQFPHDSEPEQLENIEVTMDLNKDTLDSIIKNGQENVFDIQGDSQYVGSNLDTQKQSKVENEGTLLHIITPSNEHDAEITGKTISDEMVTKGRSGENVEDSTKCDMSSNEISKEEITSDINISSIDEKLQTFNDEKMELNEIDCNNEPLLSICVENSNNSSKNISQVRSMSEKSENCEIIKESVPNSGPGLKDSDHELKTDVNEIQFHEPISSVDNFDLIESSQRNEGLFDKELVDDIDLSFDGVNPNNSDIDEERFCGNISELDNQNEFFEKSNTDLVISEAIEGKIEENNDQGPSSEEILKESIKFDQTVDNNQVIIEQIVSNTGIENVPIINKDEISTNLNICGSESLVSDEQVQHEDSKVVDCEKVTQNNGNLTNTIKIEEELGKIDNNGKIQSEFENENKTVLEKDIKLKVIDVNDDSIPPVQEKFAANEITVESSSDVECIRNESPSFQLSDLSLGKQETFLLVNSPKKESLSCDETHKTGVKCLIEKFTNQITASSGEGATINEPDIIQCESRVEEETLTELHESDESRPDKNNKLSKLIQRFESHAVEEVQPNNLLTIEEVVTESNAVEEVQPNNLTKNEEVISLDDMNVEKNKFIELIENKVSEDKETIDSTILKEFEFGPTSIPTILTDLIPDEKTNEDKNFQSQHEFDLCSIGSHDDDVESKSYTDINDGCNESLTQNENFGSTEHLLLCVEGIEDDEIQQTGVEEGKNSTNVSENSNIRIDGIVCGNDKAVGSIHEIQSSVFEFAETKNQEIDQNSRKIDSIDLEISGELPVIKRYGTSNDLLADLINEENSSQNEIEVAGKSLVSFIEIDESINIDKDEIVSAETEPGEQNLITENEKSKLEILCMDSKNSGNIEKIPVQEIRVTQDESLIIIEVPVQPDLSQNKVESQGTCVEVPAKEVIESTPVSHETESESVLDGTEEIPTENSEPRDVCYEILNEISTEKSRTEEDNLLKTSISDKQGTDSTGSELNRSISLIVNSSLESDFNLQDDGAQISECVLEVLMSNNENLESVEEPQRDSIEDNLSTEAGEACTELEEKQVTEELAWLDKKSKEVEEPASLSSFNLWPSNTDSCPSNETNPTAELSEDIDFDSIISAPSLDEALKKFEKRLSDKISKDSTSTIEQSNESRVIEGEKVENIKINDEIMIENLDQTCINTENIPNEPDMNNEICLLLENQENNYECSIKNYSNEADCADNEASIDTENHQKDDDQRNTEGSITQSIDTTENKKSLVTEISQAGESDLSTGFDQLINNEEGFQQSTCEIPDYTDEIIVNENFENETNKNSLFLGNVENTEESAESNNLILVDIKSIDNSQKESNFENEINIQLDDNKLIEIDDSKIELNVSRDMTSFLGDKESSVMSNIEILDNKELTETEINEKEMNINTEINFPSVNNDVLTASITETFVDSKLKNTIDSEVESSSICDSHSLLVDVENDEDTNELDKKCSDNIEIINNDISQIESFLDFEISPVLGNTENNKISITIESMHAPEEKMATDTSNFVEDPNPIIENDLLEGCSVNKQDDNELIKKEMDIFPNNDALLEINQTPEVTEMTIHTNSFQLESSPPSNDDQEVNNENIFQTDDNIQESEPLIKYCVPCDDIEEVNDQIMFPKDDEIIQESEEPPIKYCVPCEDSKSYPPLSNNHCSRPSSRMEIIREEAEEVNDDQEVEETTKKEEERLNIFIDSADDVSVSDISECLEKFDSLIQETELRDRDLLDIDDKLVTISVTDCDFEEQSDNLSPVESEVPECDRMISELVNVSDLESEHQFNQDLQADDNVLKCEKFIHEVHDIVRYDDLHDKSIASDLEEDSTINEEDLIENRKLESISVLEKELDSKAVPDDECKKKERKPKKSLVKSKKMFWDEKLKSLQAEQENKSRMLIERRTKTVLKDHSNKVIVAQQIPNINKNLTQQSNKIKSTETEHKKVETTNKIILNKQLHPVNDKSSQKNLIAEETVKIVVELSDENNRNLEDRKSVDNWKNYWNNLLVNEKDEEVQTMRRQPSIRVQGIVASSRNLFERTNTSLERSVSCEILSKRCDLNNKSRAPARSVGENLNKMGLETPSKIQKSEEENHKNLEKSESISNISERIKFFELSSTVSNIEANGNNNIEISMTNKNKRKSSIENTSIPCTPTTIKIDYFDDSQQSPPHQTMINKKMKSESIDSSDGDMYNPLTMTLSGRVRSFSTGKIEETPDDSLSNIEEDRSNKGSDQYLEKSDEEIKKVGMLETTPLSRAKSEGNLSMNEKITSRARFEQAKSFFKCLEEENLVKSKVGDDYLILQKPGRIKQISMDSDSCGEGCKPKKKESKYRRRGRRRRRDPSIMKVRSAPTSDSECRMSMYDSEFGGSLRNKSKRVAERFHVKHLFRDISGDTDGIFKGIPNRKAVLASLEDLRADSVPDESQDCDEPSRSQSLSSIPSGYQDEYPYLPTTPPSQYRHRSQLEDRLISRCKLVTYEMEI